MRVVIKTERTKFCTACQRTLAVSEFYTNKANKDGLTWDCKECRKAYIAANRTSQNRSRTTRRDKARAFVMGYLARGGCVECDEDDITILQFHHREPKQKNSSVSKMINDGNSLVNIFEEMKKCDVLCPNCHVRLEEQARGSYRLGYAAQLQ